MMDLGNSAAHILFNDTSFVSVTTCIFFLCEKVVYISSTPLFLRPEKSAMADKKVSIKPTWDILRNGNKRDSVPRHPR